MTNKMTVQEAGRKGGQKTASTHGPTYYSDIVTKRWNKQRKEKKLEA